MTDGESAMPSGPSDGGLYGPQLRLDQLLAQLIEQAQDVQAAQSRLRGLLHANNMINGDLALPVVLRRIVEAACQLVHARYGALGVVSSDGRGLEQFIHVGMDSELVGRIGRLPEGKGLLGALIDEPRPIRLHAIADDPRSVGFPDGHPPMTSFLGVPVRVRDEVFGNLYLADRDGGQFTEEDQELAGSLAGTAGVAIENARLFEQSSQRQQWLRASTEITQQLLASDGEEPLRVIARRIQQMADADGVTVVLPVSGTDRLMVEVATGVGAEQMTALSYPKAGTLSLQVLETGEPVLVDDLASSPYLVHLSEVVPIGAMLALPLAGSHGTRGVLLVVRLTGRYRFTDADLEMATSFANQAAVALELADARADQQRVALLEDRDRIARDLHDHVIQRLFGAGLTVESVAAGLRESPAGERLGQVVGDIDDTIRQIRNSIFRLRGPIATGTGEVRTRLLELVGELVPLLGFEPQVSFTGSVDLMISTELSVELQAVLREALTNVARHASARRAQVAVSVTGAELAVEVVDDGAGLAESDRRSGLANLGRRAEQRGGTFEIVSPAPAGSIGTGKGGTLLRWTVPLS